MVQKTYIVGKGNFFMNKEQKNLFLGVIMGIFILGFILLGYFALTGGIISKRESTKEKEICPYECCPEGDYLLKNCPLNYGCIHNSCVPIDSDNDGLSDIEERQIGTNPQLYDTDGDTLSDYQEYKNLGTNPTNKNSDRDRYDDNEDSEPLKTNSAYITTESMNKAWNWDIVNIAILIATFGGIELLNPNMVLAEPNVIVKISNLGDDYSSYVTYDVVFRVSNVEVRRKEIYLNQMTQREILTKNYNEVITLSDIPEMIINLVKEKTTDWTIEIENIDYERFN